KLMPRRGLGTLGHHSLLQNLRLSEAWGLWGIILCYKTCASLRLGGLGGHHSLLQNLRLAEAWGSLTI
ncbi:MAG: hypothetical protein ACK4GN_02215, partial [Runella sp.]